MAYREETDQQFIESIVRQASRRPLPTGFNHGSPEVEDEINEPLPTWDNPGYSSDSTRSAIPPAPAKAPSTVGMGPRMQLLKVNNQIRNLMQQKQELEQQLS